MAGQKILDSCCFVSCSEVNNPMYCNLKLSSVRSKVKKTLLCNVFATVPIGIKVSLFSVFQVSCYTIDGKSI